jgi:ribosomal protein S6
MAEMSQAVEASSQANAPKDSRPLYEIGFHLVPTLDEAQVKEITEALKAEIAKASCEITSEEFPQKMMLSYVIERSDSGKREKFAESYFGWMNFVTEERAGILTIETFLRTNRNFLRYLLIETAPEETQTQRRAVFSSNRLEGETLKKPTGAPEAEAEVSDEELNKSLDALVN